ncbi:penicillin-binding protein 1A [Arenibaculum sp.]|jgi:penicillin-binding protein 1A|uniref:penicillin-binding protein 1A n=1 Tax=Arenibaculum sp. TaxID=2865862 RepID=UPI002E150A4B|nr:penicillin-binding protein 1A [Arenibaculum sp.]
MRIIVGLLSTAVVLGILAVAGVIGVVYHYSRGLPDIDQLARYQPPTVTRVHAGDGRLLAEYASERRIFVPFEALPRRVMRAFISAEDQNFYEHPGIDFLAIARAMVTNVRKVANDERPIGASTITQQVARNFLLTNEVSIARKIKEMILAWRIEQVFDKDQILELYLNEIYLGNRSYGVAAAALNYFNKPLDELTIAEAAFLGALPKAPDRYFRSNYRDQAVERRNWVIGRMAEDGYITPDEARLAMAEPLEFRRRDETETVEAPYFAEEVRREIVDRFGEETLYEGGLSIRTTVDPVLQRHATRALRDGLVAFDRRSGWRGPVTRFESLQDWQGQLAALKAPAGAEEWRLAVVTEVGQQAASIGLGDGSTAGIPMEELRWARPIQESGRPGPEPKRPADVLRPGDVVLVEPLAEEGADEAGEEARDGEPTGYALRQIPEVQGGLVAMDPHTGRVLAMSGGFSADISQFNRATQALRQPGSSFKPFVYLTALDNGYTPSSMVLDAPFVMDQGPGLPLWRPQNFSEEFYGPTPLRVGIEKSRNVMTVRLAQAVGMDKVADTAERFGIYDELPELLAMSLGAGETTVLRMVTAYSMLVNGGKRIVPTLIDRVQDRSGETIFRHDVRPCAGCADVAWTGGEAPAVPDTREQVGDPRTIYQTVNILQGVVERGTGRALLSLGRPIGGKTGTSNDYVDAWWIGFTPDLVAGVFVGYDQPRPLGSATGTTAAVPIFKQFMEAALEDEPAIPFRVPPGLRLVRVDPGSGQLAEPGMKGAIWEAFLPGTEPRPGEDLVLDGSGARGVPEGAIPTAAPAMPAPAGPGIGTGGLY